MKILFIWCNRDKVPSLDSWAHACVCSKELDAPHERRCRLCLFTGNGSFLTSRWTCPGRSSSYKRELLTHIPADEPEQDVFSDHIFASTTIAATVCITRVALATKVFSLVDLISPKSIIDSVSVQVPVARNSHFSGSSTSLFYICGFFSHSPFYFAFLSLFCLHSTLCRRAYQLYLVVSSAVPSP